MANFPKSPPAIGRSTGLTGLTGATGAPGGGTVAGVVTVDSLSGTPRSVTDWGPLINTAVSGGSRYFVFGPYDYPYTTTINLASVTGVTFQGAGGACWSSPPTTSLTRLLWNGTGTGYAIDASHAIAFNAADIAFVYTSASYTGTYLTSFGGTKPGFTRCGFTYASNAASTITANVAIYLGTNIEAVFDRCTFEGFHQYLRGADNGSGALPAGTYSNGMTARDCVFQGQCTHSVVNPGEAWEFDRCTFECIGATNSAEWVTSHIFGDGQNGNAWGIDVTLRNCSMWDADGRAGSTQQTIVQPSGEEWHVLVEGHADHLTLGSKFTFGGNGCITIVGGRIVGTIDVGDGTQVASVKNSIVCIGADLTGGFVNLTSGNTTRRHDKIVVLGNRNFGNVADDGIITGLISERYNNVDEAAPTFQVHAGGPASMSINADGGTNLAGFVKMTYGGAGTSGTGLLVDVIFSVYPAVFNSSPVVQLTAANADAAACQAYTNFDGSNDASRFSIGIGAGFTAAQHPAWTYRVIHA